MEKVLITGITGQDGLFLTREIILSNPNTKIYGISRNKNNLDFEKKLDFLGITNRNNIEMFNVDLSNKDEVNKFINSIEMTQIYNLSGPSSVYESIKNPISSYDKITVIFENLINSIKSNNLNVSFFQASSSEMFGKSKLNTFSENSNFNPQSPYAKAKLHNHQRVIDLSRTFNIKSGIMFNHESEFRDSKYLFSKIIRTAKKIKTKELNKLTVGSLTYERDWLFAGDVAKAMIKIINEGKENSYIISSGKSHSIKYLISTVFDFYGLEWEKYVEVDSSLLRAGDPEKIYSDPSRLTKELGWKPKYNFEQLIERCILKNKSF